ncbi:MAG: type II toxin-antitoxin system RelE/ParE family toxin [Actinomycetota bacterium]|nr:type II toxin-antitoxin system RelE/ParE family toxin [Actinomycetota bacterium]
MSTWHLVVAASAERKLGQLPEKIAAAIVEFMLGPLLENPRKVGRPLRRELLGLYSARRGSYRVVFQLDEEKRTVHVVRIDHRSDVYRPR